jgi:hypothetical protein
MSDPERVRPPSAVPLAREAPEGQILPNRSDA